MASVLFQKRPPGRMPTSFFYTGGPTHTLAGGGGGGVSSQQSSSSRSARDKKKYFSAEHRDKVKTRGNLERAIAVPLEDGNWEMALDLMCKKYRRAGLTATHLQEALATAARQLHLLPSPTHDHYSGNNSNTNSSYSTSSSPTSLSSRHRQLASKILAIKGECVEGNLPQSAGLWTQLVFLQSQMGLVEDALDSAETAMRCLSSVSSSSVNKTSNSQFAVSVGGKCLPWGSKRTSSSSSAPSSATQHSAGGRPKPAASSSSSLLAPAKGLSYATRLAMGEMMLPVAAKQGKVRLAEDIAKDLMGIDVRKIEEWTPSRVIGQTSSSSYYQQGRGQQADAHSSSLKTLAEQEGNGNSMSKADRFGGSLSSSSSSLSSAEKMVLRWLAEACARNGDASRALRLAAISVEEKESESARQAAAAAAEVADSFPPQQRDQKDDTARRLLPSSLLRKSGDYLSSTEGSSYLSNDVFFKDLSTLAGAVSSSNKSNSASHTKGAAVAAAGEGDTHSQTADAKVLNAQIRDAAAEEDHTSERKRRENSYDGEKANELNTSNRSLLFFSAAYARTQAALRGLSRQAASSVLLTSATTCEGAMLSLRRLIEDDTLRQQQQHQQQRKESSGVQVNTIDREQHRNNLSMDVAVVESVLGTQNPQTRAHYDALFTAIGVVDVLYPRLFEALMAECNASILGSIETVHHNDNNSNSSNTINNNKNELSSILKNHMLALRSPSRVNELRGILNILGVFQQAATLSTSSSASSSAPISSSSSSTLLHSLFLSTLRTSKATPVSSLSGEHKSPMADPWLMALTLVWNVFGIEDSGIALSSLLSSSASSLPPSSSEGAVHSTLSSTATHSSSSVAFWSSSSNQREPSFGERPPIYFDQVCLDVLFAMLPVPAPRDVFIRWEQEHRQKNPRKNVAKNETRGGENSYHNSTTETRRWCASTFTISLLDVLLAVCDEIMISTPIAKVAASALLNTDNSTTRQQKQNAPPNWRRALLLIRNSPINSREKKTKHATPLELEVARIVTLLQRYGPCDECRREAVLYFPHLFPKEAVLRALGGEGSNNSEQNNNFSADLFDNRSDEEVQQEVESLLFSTQSLPPMKKKGESEDADNNAGTTAKGSESGEENAGLAGGGGDSDGEDDLLWMMHASDSSVEKDAADDGARPSDAEYNFLRGFRNLASSSHSSSSSKIDVSVSSSSSSLPEPLSKTTAHLADVPLFSGEASRRGLEFYFKNRIQRTQEDLMPGGMYDRTMAKIRNEKIRLDEAGLGGDGSLKRNGHTKNGLGTSNDVSSLPSEILDRYFPADKDPFADPRPAPIAIDSEVSGWSQIDRNSGSKARRSMHSHSVANPMWPKQMNRLNNPLRSWRESGPHAHREAVREWNGRSSM